VNQEKEEKNNSSSRYFRSGSGIQRQDDGYLRQTFE
jgi:hypothetical protein